MGSNLTACSALVPTESKNSNLVPQQRECGYDSSISVSSQQANLPPKTPPLCNKHLSMKSYQDSTPLKPRDKERKNKRIPRLTLNLESELPEKRYDEIREEDENSRRS